MNGSEIITWAVKECERRKVPPTDAAILQVLREAIGDIRPESIKGKP